MGSIYLGGLHLRWFKAVYALQIELWEQIPTLDFDYLLSCLDDRLGSNELGRVDQTDDQGHSRFVFVAVELNGDVWIQTFDQRQSEVRMLFID